MIEDKYVMITFLPCDIWNTIIGGVENLGMDYIMLDDSTTLVNTIAEDLKW